MPPSVRSLPSTHTPQLPGFPCAHRLQSSTPHGSVGLIKKINTVSFETWCIEILNKIICDIHVILYGEWYCDYQLSNLTQCTFGNIAWFCWINIMSLCSSLIFTFYMSYVTIVYVLYHSDFGELKVLPHL